MFDKCPFSSEQVVTFIVKEPFPTLKLSFLEHLPYCGGIAQAVLSLDSMINIISVLFSMTHYVMVVKKKKNFRYC